MFSSEVRRIWDKSITGTKQFVIWKKLKFMQKPLLAIHKSTFPDVISKEQEARELLTTAQNALAGDVANANLAG